ncbi:ephrin type-A receptor 3-like [Rhopilema esculentum]|uniref:ephrin type-A receptor 3-like n=1 Tax=Rhopilema esculentum TaxID=499914 RepID=UPI0031D5576C
MDLWLYTALFLLRQVCFIQYGSCGEVHVALPAFPTWKMIPSGSGAVNKWRYSGSAYEACSMNDGVTDGYLIIPFIKTHPANQVKVEIGFAMRNCALLDSNCKLFFDVYGLVSQKLDIDVPTPAKYKYNYIGIAKNTTTLGYKLQTYTVTFQVQMQNKAGLYLAMRDLGFCGMIYRVDVSYMTCLTEIYGKLVKFPFTVAPNSTTAEIEIPGECIQNAIQKLPGSSIKLLCRWTGAVHTNEECICRAGYEKFGKKCDECLLGYFKTKAGNQGCGRCGENSISIKPAVKCPCEQAHYRLGHRELDYNADCHALPSAPVDVKIDGLSNTSGIITWKKPVDPGELDLWYSLSCVGNQIDCIPIQYQPSTKTFNVTSVQLRNLTAFTQYEIVIYSGNNVSEVAGKSKWSFVRLKFRTKPGVPSPVRHITVSQNHSHLNLHWDPPKFIRDDNVTYEAKCNATMSRFSHLPQVSFEVKVAGNITCKIRPKNSVGTGPWLETNIYFAISKSTTSTAKPTTHSTKKVHTSTTSHSSSISHSFTTSKPMISKSTLNSTSSDRSNNEVTFILAGAVALVVLIAGIFLIRYVVKKRKRGSSADDVTVRWRRGSRANSYGRLSANKTALSDERHKKQNAIYNGGIKLDEEAEPVYLEIPDDEYEFSMDKITILKTLGEGEFGIVYLANALEICGNKGTSQVAVKVLKDCATEKSRDDFKTELGIMKKLKFHQNVVRLLGCCTAEGTQSIILEFLRQGSLLDFLRKLRGYDGTAGCVLHSTSLSPRQLIDFAYMVADGMSHIASQNVVHRDLACRNILVGTHQGKFVCKISDLGLAREPCEASGIYQREKQALLPIKWMAYESLFHGVSSFRSDVWSFGIVLYEITTIGNVPYPEHKAKEVPALIEKGFRMERPLHCSAELYSIMTSCWQKEESRRPSFEELRCMLKTLLEEDDHIYLNLDKFNDALYVRFDAEEADENNRI